MEPITAAKLAVKLAPAAVKAVKKVKNWLKERQIRKELEESLKDAERAFRERVPKGTAVHPDILNKFFDGAVFEYQYQRLLQDEDYDLNVLETDFYDSGYERGGIPGFNPRLAIAEFFDQFIQSAGRKESFVNVVIPLKQSEGFKGRYFSQLAKAYEHLSFAGTISNE